MKTILKLLILSMASFIITPQMALAAWWNPFSWFSQQESVVEIKTIVTSPLEKEGASNTESDKETQLTEKVVEKIIEKPIIQTITVQDPALQAKINTLILENSNLKIEIEKLKRLNESLTSKSEPSTISKFVAKCLEVKDIYMNSREQLERINSKFNDLYENGLRENPGRDPVIWKKVIEKEKVVEMQSLKQKISQATEDKNLYCD